MGKHLTLNQRIDEIGSGLAELNRAADDAMVQCMMHYLLYRDVSLIHKAISVFRSLWILDTKQIYERAANRISTPARHKIEELGTRYGFSAGRDRYRSQRQMLNSTAGSIPPPFNSGEAGGWYFEKCRPHFATRPVPSAEDSSGRYLQSRGMPGNEENDP